MLTNVSNGYGASSAIPDRLGIQAERASPKPKPTPDSANGRSAADLSVNLSERSPRLIDSAFLVSSDQKNISARQRVALDGLEALREAAQRGEQKKQRQQVSVQRDAIAVPLPPVVSTYATPLAALNDRDRAALSEFFQRHDMAAIEADITQILLRLWPEPCWEDDPFEFLRDFL